MSYRRKAVKKKLKKMNIQEIIDIENHNNGEIHLHKEGFPKKAFQQSAYLFTRDVKAFKFSKRNINRIKNNNTESQHRPLVFPSECDM